MNRMVAFLVLSASVGIPLLVHPAQAAQAKPPAAMARVKVEIRGGDEIRRAMYSYLAQGFQSCGTVELVEADPQWTIKMVTLTTQDEEGNATAVGLSVVVLKHGPQMDMLRLLAQAWHYVIKAGLLQKDQPLEVGVRTLVAGIDRLPKTDDLTLFSQHRMCLIPTHKLGEACGDIVKDFNARLLRSSDVDHSGAAEQPSQSGRATASR
jgi:hypothetical protein